MPVDFEYKLDTGSKKFECPNCGKKTFVRYRDIKGNYLMTNDGRCDREIHCGYLSIPNIEKVIVEPKQVSKKPLMFIDYEDAIKTSYKLEQNTLIRYFIEKLGAQATVDLISKYRIGMDQSNPSTINWTIWWQFDVQDRCRGGKLMKYNPDGHRDKSQSSTWYHKLNQKYNAFEVTQCYFGEHLISEYPNKRIAIVESEKTACIASVFLPDFIWLASGSVGGLGYDKSKVLKHRNVTLFPDLGAFDKWKVKAQEYGWNISRILEDRATAEEREQGLDLADYLV
ncbi:DUF6371 domain-containing protein [Sphingobacterium multivorum]|uniref:DUF6371 domain-containing protein n=1 Tax=Sphingobacterium multivorum TaxID=28454 RepID=UPI0031BA3228